MGNDQKKQGTPTERSRTNSVPGDNKQAESSNEIKSKGKGAEGPKIVTADSQNFKKSYSFRTTNQSFVQNETIGRAGHSKGTTHQTYPVTRETFIKNLRETSNNLSIDDNSIKGSNVAKLERKHLLSSTLTAGHITNIADSLDTVEKEDIKANNLHYKFKEIPGRESSTIKKKDVKLPNDPDQEKERQTESSTRPVKLLDDSSEKLELPFNRSFCNDCLKKQKIEKFEAEHICFSCETYLCSTCINFHQHHRNSFSDKEDFAIGEKTNHDIYVDRTIHMLLDELTGEDDRLEKFETDTKSLCNRIDIKHSKDIKDCWIRNITILKDGVIAVTDSENNSIKLLDIKHNIHRRIKLSSWPCGIAETLKESDNSTSNLTEQSVFDSTRNELKKDCLIAITCPYKEIIMILDITKSPAVIVKSISVHSQCFNMIIHKGEFLVVCMGTPSSINFITESGETSNIIKLYHENLPLRDWYPRIQIHPGTETIYVSSYDDNVILAMNFKGQVLNSFTQENLLPYGIVVAEDQTVFVCSEYKNALYQLSRHFETLELLIDEKDCALPLPAALARHDGKLYISSDSVHHPNIITVISIV